MAFMIPPIFSEDSCSPGERDVFYRLKNDPITSNWYVIHSLEISKHKTQVTGEADFVVIVPNQGVLFLEVKSHFKVRRENGLWYFGNKKNGESRGPFKQASSAMYSLREGLLKKRPDLGNVLFWSAVIFPRCNFNEQSPEWHPWQLIDSERYRSQPISKTILNIFKNARQTLVQKGVNGFSADNRQPYEEQCKQIANCFRGDFEVIKNAKTEKYWREKELLKYTEEQVFALDSMELNKRTIFIGPAGTGKTFLAIEAARRYSAKHKEVLFLCFNKNLSAQLSEELKDCKNVKITHIHKYANEIHGNHESKNRDNNEYWKSLLPQMAIDHLLQSENEAPFDALIVDEAQDILFDKYLELLDLNIKGGISTGEWRIFGDFSGQNIYGIPTEEMIDNFTAYAGENPKSLLLVNCRNVPQIAGQAQVYGGISPKYSRVLRQDNDVSPKIVKYRNDREQVDHLKNAINHLLGDGFSKDEIVVLSLKNDEDSCAYHLSRDDKEVKISKFSSKNSGVKYATIHSFKGLESPAVILTDIDSIDDAYKRTLIYVGISRARDNLTIICKNKALENLLNHINKTDKL